MLGPAPRASIMLSTQSATELHPLSYRSFTVLSVILGRMLTKYLKISYTTFLKGCVQSEPFYIFLNVDSLPGDMWNAWQTSQTRKKGG